MMIWDAPPPLETSPEERAERVNLLRPINCWFCGAFDFIGISLSSLLRNLGVDTQWQLGCAGLAVGQEWTDLGFSELDD